MMHLEEENNNCTKSKTEYKRNHKTSNFNQLYVKYYTAEERMKTNKLTKT